MSVDETTDIEESEAEEVYEGPRQARLRLSRLDPWSVMKTAFVLSLGIAVVIIVALVLLWGVLAALGVFSSVNDAVESVAGAGSSVFSVKEFFTLGRVLGTSVVLGVVNVVLFTALATLFAFMYNLTVPFTRGIEVTLSEE